jgi:CRP-like cAMP-binding protein
MRVESVKERQTVFEEGETGDKFYIVLKGRVTVFKNCKTEIGSTILVSF